MPEEEPVVGLRPKDFQPRRVMTPMFELAKNPTIQVSEPLLLEHLRLLEEIADSIPKPKSALERIAEEDLF